MNVKTVIENPPFKLSENDVNALLGHFDDFRPYDWAQLKNVIGISLLLLQVLGEFVPSC